MDWHGRLTLARRAAGPTLVADRSPWLADRFIESYVCWREACAEVRRAYAHWNEDESWQRGVAFAHYRAALDREEEAALIHAEWAERIRFTTDRR